VLAQPIHARPTVARTTTQTKWRWGPGEELLTNAAKEFDASENELQSGLQQRPGFLEGRPGNTRSLRIRLADGTVATHEVVDTTRLADDG
jgi:hypothetical protein